MVDEDFVIPPGYSLGMAGPGYARLEKGRKTILLHRYVNKTPEGLDTDHINGDKLDNRRANLRSVSRRENLHNQSAKGYSFDAARGKWSAVAADPHGKRKWLGRYSTEEEAHAAYLTYCRATRGHIPRAFLPVTRQPCPPRKNKSL